MAEATGNLVAPEYQAILDNILAMYGKKKSQAEAGAIGEAQRRGLVNPTGTSDIEGMLRSAAVSPIAEAEAGAIADLTGRGADRAATERYGTSERIAGQQYGTSERLGSQDYNKILQEYMNQYNSGEAQKQRDYDLQSLNLQRGWATQDAAKKRKGWWKDALSNVVSTGIGTGLGTWVGGMGGK
jgi:hypothetical protein